MAHGARIVVLSFSASLNPKEVTQGLGDLRALLPPAVELVDVPFFAQEDYQCGPAALATMLNQRGVLTTPGALKDKVYIPSREGSLQVEMVAAARNHEMLVYPLQPRLEAVLAEVAATDEMAAQAAVGEGDDVERLVGQQRQRDDERLVALAARDGAADQALAEKLEDPIVGYARQVHPGVHAEEGVGRRLIELRRTQVALGENGGRNGKSHELNAHGEGRAGRGQARDYPVSYLVAVVW